MSVPRLAKVDALARPVLEHVVEVVRLRVLALATTNAPQERVDQVAVGVMHSARARVL